MNWFERHLNWTWVLSYLALFVANFILAFAIVLADPNVSVEALDTAGYLIDGVGILVVSGWVIRQKGRSLWWLLLVGWFSPLWLTNKKTKPESLGS